MMQYISPLPDTLWSRTWPRSMAVLGSTGSIGRSTLDVVRRQKERFQIAALAGGKNTRLLAEQALEFRPPVLGVLDRDSAEALRALLPAGYSPDILTGQAGYEEIASLPGVGLVVSAQSGAAGLRATATAAAKGKVIALANKESLVMAGALIRELCAASGAAILPVDSEHNAIFQCIAGSEPAALQRVILTASGGPFRDMNREQLAGATLEQALAHPNWNMGPKITIDSSTLMNKGLEVIEACHLYGLTPKEVEVVIHRESIIHSLAEFADGSQLAHLGLPDMRMAIAYCLGWPQRIQTGVERLNLARVGNLSFSSPDEELFPCLGLARRAWAMGPGGAIALNAANEVAVAAFLEQRIGYTDIARAVGNALDSFERENPPAQTAFDLEAILALDANTRLHTEKILLLL